MKKRMIAACLALFCMLSCLGGCGEKETPSTAMGEGILSSFAAADLDGNTVDQSILQGKKLTVVNVWATTCGPCLREMPALAEIRQEYESKGVQIVGVVLNAVDRNKQPQEEILAAAREIVAETGADYRHLIPTRTMSAICEVQGVPTTFFVNENGVQIGDPVVGPRTKAQWTALINSILKELGL